MWGSSPQNWALSVEEPLPFCDLSEAFPPPSLKDLHQPNIHVPDLTILFCRKQCTDVPPPTSFATLSILLKYVEVLGWVRLIASILVLVMPTLAEYIRIFGC